jgi:hypothetical protein
MVRSHIPTFTQYRPLLRHTPSYIKIMDSLVNNSYGSGYNSVNYLLKTKGDFNNSGSIETVVSPTGPCVTGEVNHKMDRVIQISSENPICKNRDRIIRGYDS